MGSTLERPGAVEKGCGYFKLLIKRRRDGSPSLIPSIFPPDDFPIFLKTVPSVKFLAAHDIGSLCPFSTLDIRRKVSAISAKPPSSAMPANPGYSLGSQTSQQYVFLRVLCKRWFPRVYVAENSPWQDNVSMYTVSQKNTPRERLSIWGSGLSRLISEEEAWCKAFLNLLENYTHPYHR